MNIDRIKNVSKLDARYALGRTSAGTCTFIAYVEERETSNVGTGTMRLSKIDARRLAKLLSDPEAESEVQEDGYSTWIDFVDRLAHFNSVWSITTRTGTYAGYTSQEPSFPDNYIQVDAKAYDETDRR